jgi:hypothetical protein
MRISDANYENLQNQNIIKNNDFTSKNKVNNLENKKKKWKFCLLQILIFFALGVTFLVNFICTYDNFKDNKYIHINPEVICGIQIKEHNECLNQYRNKTDSNIIIEECVGANMRLQTCYDQVDIYNRKCFMYMSEFEKCVRDTLAVNNKNRNNKIDFLREKCGEEISNIHICTSEYVIFDPFILLHGLDIDYSKE